MKISSIKVGMWVETNVGVGQVLRVGGTHPPSVRVRIQLPFPRGDWNCAPRDVLREVEAPAEPKP